MSGSIEQIGDKDYFRIILKCSKRIVDIYTRDNRIDTYGELFNSNHELIVSADGRYNDFKIRKELSAGTYYIAVSNRKNQTGNYHIKYYEESTCKD
ncbi:MAG: hypothetical protein DSZ07_00625 [Sulfurovum sp.]|nr:MAG: hypothetical protein DSZ07_00625 [Sulfurovum sp.]